MWSRSHPLVSLVTPQTEPFQELEWASTTPRPIINLPLHTFLCLLAGLGHAPGG